MFYPASVCLSVCLSVYQPRVKTTDRIFMKILPEMYLEKEEPIEY